MPTLGIRVTNELHGQIQDAVNTQNISLSDFVRQSVEHLFYGGKTLSNASGEEKLTPHLEQQLAEKESLI